MDNKLMESYLDYIAGQVIDEDKIVTYKSLSRNLNIHINTAKQLLHTFLTREKSKNTFSISATYLVAGKVIDGSFNISVVNESDLKSAHSSLIEVTSEHVYSVHKGKNIKEIRCLCGVGKESTSNSSNLVIKHYKNVLKPKEKVKKILYCDEAEKNKVIKEALAPTVVAEEKKKEEITNTVTTHQIKKTSPKGNSEKAQASVRKPAGDIANLFAKVSQKNAEKSVADVKRESNNTDKGTSSKRRSESKDSLKKKAKGSKRRRIQMVSDSEESSIDDEKELIEIDSEEQSPPRVANLEEEMEPKEFVSKNKRKKRKMIDRTVMNEDGYLETKKEIVWETDSESELEEAAKSKEEKKPKGDKGKGVQGMKQSSIFSFFKKS